MVSLLVFIGGHALMAVELSTAECTPVHSHSGLSVGQETRLPEHPDLPARLCPLCSVSLSHSLSIIFFPLNPSAICHFKPSLSLSPGANHSFIKVG